MVVVLVAVLLALGCLGPGLDPCMVVLVAALVLVAVSFVVLLRSIRLLFAVLAAGAVALCHG